MAKPLSAKSLISTFAVMRPDMSVVLEAAGPMVLLNDGAEEPVCLDEPGSYIVVPKGLWHTALIAEPTKMLFMTPGEGTRHADVPPVSE